MDNKPRVRAIEAFPIQQDGKTLIYLKDPLNFARPLGISPVGYFLLAQFDGRHAYSDLSEVFAQRFRAPLAHAEHGRAGRPPMSAAVTRMSRRD